MPKLSIARRAKLVAFVAFASVMVLDGSLARPGDAFGRVRVAEVQSHPRPTDQSSPSSPVRG
jgi:hypothetical protein